MVFSGLITTLIVVIRPYAIQVFLPFVITREDRLSKVPTNLS